MLQLTTLNINNFRSIRRATLELTELAVLVGKNDVGKSNVLAAIRLLLEGGTTTEFDHYTKEEAIEIGGTLENASEYLPLCDDRNRTKVEERIDREGHITLRRINDETRKFGKIEIQDPKDGSFGTPTGIDAALKAFLPEVIFIGALDDVSEEAEGNRKGAIGKLMAQILSRVRERIEPEMERAYFEANKLLNQHPLAQQNTIFDSRLPELRDVEARISHHLGEMFPNATAVLRVNLPHAEEIFKNAEVVIREGSQEDPYFRRGHGLQRALHLSLLRSLAFYIRQEEANNPLNPSSCCSKNQRHVCTRAARLK